MNKKTLALVLALVLAFSVLTGCSGSGSNSGSANSGSANSGSANSGSKNSSSAQNSEKSEDDLSDLIGKYPIVDPGTLTLKIWSTMGDTIANDIKDFNDIVAFQEMEKRTGIHVEWTHAVAGQDDEAFNLMIATRDLPDLIRNNIGSQGKEAIKYVVDDVIINLTPYMDYAPNFKEIIYSNTDLYRQISDDNGGIYFFPSLNIDPGTRAYRGFMIRQDWLDKANLERPKNTDELRAVLEKWQELDINGDGEKNEFYTGRGSSDFQVQKLLWCFGAHFDFQLKDGKVTHGFLTDEFKTGMAYIAGLYADGLIDPDYLTNDTSKWESKFISEIAGASYSIASRVDKFQKNIPGSVFMPIATLAGPDGQMYSYDNTLTNIYKTQQTVVITTANENIEKSMMWMDYVYSPDGEILFNLGVEGVSFYRDENGYTHYTEALTNDPQGRPQNQMQLLYCPGGSQWPVNVTMDALSCQKTPTELMVFETYAKELPNTTEILPPFTLTEEEMSSITSKLTDVNSYVEECLGTLIIGKTSLEKIDSEIIPNLKNIGIEDIIAVYQTAYERYMAKG